MDGFGGDRRRPSASLAGLSDILRRREVRRVVYFHCDHFEPWRPLTSSRTLEENAADVLRFAEISAANPFSRKLTLFYKAHIGVTRRLGQAGVTALAPDDLFGFLPRTAAQEATFATAMRGLLERVPHEVQVHVHHEYYTFNTAYKDEEIIRGFADPVIRARDPDRFELALRLVLDAIRKETGLPLDRWFFVHGLWALNASDPTVCHITNEIEILKRNGCLGDFTFPAGRPNVDPVLELPYFVRPWDAPRAYLLPQAEPEQAHGNAAAAADKFFIWASKIRHRGSSLDYYSEHVADALAQPESFAHQILSDSYAVDGTLYFKTHSHSMHVNYWRDGPAAVFPHQHPGVRQLMGAVFNAAAHAGAEVEFLTAGEVYDEFVRQRPAPNQGFALVGPTNLLTAATAAPILTADALGADLCCADEVNAVCAEVLLEALRRDGAAAPGVGDYYRTRAEAGEVLTSYEVRLTKALFREEAFETIFEIGSGVSALPAFIALNGARAIGIERDSARVSLSRAILARLAEGHPELPEMCEIRRASAPVALRGIDGSRSAAVFTNVTGSMS
ncbi:MAG: hypothetical protein ABI056_07975, partial [Caulobacteraceae bacterium]